MISNARILIVEDEWIVAKNIQRRLERMGYAISSVVATGKEAIKKAEEDNTDLVLMDIELLGKMDGIEAAKQIHSRFNIPVIYLTAYADEKTLDKAKITEPFGYITKPFEDRELHITIEMALYKHKVEEALNRQREQFISVLIHDLKGPLVPIQGYIKRLLDGKVKSEEDRERILEIVQEASQNLLQAIEYTSKGLRDKSVLQSFNPKEVDLCEILTLVAMNLTPKAEEKGIEIIINNTGKRDWNKIEKVILKVDTYQLKTLIENLLGNAIKYAKRVIQVELTKTDSHNQFVISDDGPGIPEKYHNKIFEEYFQVPGSQKGTGLGLCSVKKVVENHKGQIAVKSSLNIGTSFEITLPC